MLTGLFQSIRSYFASRWSKEARIRNERLSPKIINKLPGASFCLYFLLFTPFIIFGIIMIAAPYMTEDYALTDCKIIGSRRRQTNDSPVKYSQQIYVNYTIDEITHQGYRTVCLSTSLDEFNRCNSTLTQIFPCWAEIDVTEENPLEENVVLTPEEYHTVLSSNSKTFALFFILTFGFFILCYVLYVMVQFVLKKYILEKITDTELGLNKYASHEYDIKYAPDCGGVGEPFESKIVKYLAQTALERKETIEWVYRPSFIHLIRSQSWILGCYIFIGMAPIICLLVYFAIYSVVRYPWKDWALYVIEFVIAYVILLYFFYVFVYLFTARGTKYYITSSRSICVMRFLAIVWIQQFPHADILEIERSEEKSGSVLIVSKRFGTGIRFFSYVENLEMVRVLLLQKMNWEEKPSDDLMISETHLGESLDDHHVDIHDENTRDMQVVHLE